MDLGDQQCLHYDDRRSALHVRHHSAAGFHRLSKLLITMNQYSQLERATFPGIRTETRIILLLKSGRRGPLDGGVVPEVLCNKLDL